MFRSKITFLLLAAVMIVSAGGCISAISAPFESAPVNREGESFAEFNDVPYPSHLSFNKSESLAYTRRNVRAGVTVISGKMSVDELGAYYDSHLPGHGWSPVAEAQSSALVSTWKKGDRILTIVAKPSSIPFNNDIRAELWVAPPHTKEDLGQRVIYKPSTESSSSSSGSFLGLGGGNKNKAGVSEEDI